MPKHYRPAGKKKEGNAAKYITRTKAVHFLQLSLSNFRKLCILKGIFPREPKKKVEGNHKTYYHMKDIMFLHHDPLVDKFRDIRAHKKKIRKAFAKKNKDLADRLIDREPKIVLDRLVLERYPTFVDALRDLDDCLTMVHLFAALPAVQGERIQVERIHNCRRLSHEWQAFVSRTHCLRKTFISVKGIYYQAEIEGQKITWLTPHAMQQVLTDDVDFNVMLTFLSFYETLLGFVNFKLYHSINVKYPPILDPRLEALAVELYALYRCIAAAPREPSGNSQAITSGTDEVMSENNDATSEESELRMAQLKHQLPTTESGTLMRMIEDASAEVDEDEDTKSCKGLFKDEFGVPLKFFLSREVPRESLLFIIPAFGGAVSWEGEGSPFNESDESITHQIVDRPTQGHIFLSREYVQPQWIFDCVNARIVLPTEKYLVGRAPPPHLSPFVNNEEEGYVPEYAETIKRLQDAARKQILPMPDSEGRDLDMQNHFAEGVIDRSEANEAAELKRKLKEREKQHLDQLMSETKGITYSSYVSNKKQPSTTETETKDDDEAVEEEEEEKSIDPEQLAEDDRNLSVVTMTRRKRKLLEAIEIGKGRKKDKVELLKSRKQKAQAKKSG